MLSRRERLLVQPWEERRFKDHRAKVASALPAVDARAPAPRPHVAVKLKAWQRERERAARVAAHNHGLLQRLAAIMRVNRLDNHWQKPPPNFQHKVGQYVEARELDARLAARAAACAPDPGLRPAHVRCYACETRKMHYERRAPAAGAAAAREHSLPSIY